MVIEAETWGLWRISIPREECSEHERSDPNVDKL
jgi:hypothetical protein